MRSAPRKLRNDLIIRQYQAADGMSAVIKHPVSGKFFRLGEAELFITQQLDGKTPIEVIQRRAETTFGAVLPIETLNAFLLSLNKHGVLETADANRKEESKQQGRVRGNPLVCRIKLCDPCQLLNRLVRQMRFFFTPYFVALSAVAILLALSVTAASWSEFRQSLPRLYQPSAIPAVILILLVVIVVHEFGHGMTCTHFGGEVHEMGFVLIFLQPALYCNVSDAWLFPERSKRLWVGFAGPYFELFLWALAVFTWRATEAGTWVNFVSLSVMATSGLKTLLNFNPLIKLDGYYLLSDYLEIPNLRRRSFRFVGSLIERLFGIESASQPEENLSPRERRIFRVTRRAPASCSHAGSPARCPCCARAAAVRARRDAAPPKSAGTRAALPRWPSHTRPAPRPRERWNGAGCRVSPRRTGPPRHHGDPTRHARRRVPGRAAPAPG